MKTKTRPEAGASSRKLSRAVIAGGSAMVLGGISLATGANPAAADHDHDDPTGVLNTAGWRVCTDGTAALGSPAVDWAVALYNSHPDLTVERVGVGASCPSWNVWVRSDYWPDLAEGGATVCFNSPSPGTCSIKVVLLNGSVNDFAANPGAQWKQAACREFGHVAGLGDRFTTSSCMTEGAAPPIATIPDGHDWDAIATTY